MRPKTVLTEFNGSHFPVGQKLSSPKQNFFFKSPFPQFSGYNSEPGYFNSTIN
jgi:hypothetical protein